MSDKSSHVFEGAGAVLVKTYSTGVSGTTTALSTESYDRLLVYVSVSAIVSSGKASVIIECSTDGDNWFVQSGTTDATAGQTPNGCVLSTTGDFCIPFEKIGKFSRVVMTYVSGTSLTVDLCHIEAKS